MRFSSNYCLHLLPSFIIFPPQQGRLQKCIYNGVRAAKWKTRRHQRNSFNYWCAPYKFTSLFKSP